MSCKKKYNVYYKCVFGTGFMFGVPLFSFFNLNEFIM